MPLFDFQCPDHGKFEAYKRAGGATVAPCPSCGVESERVFALTSFMAQRAYDRQVDGDLPPANRKDDLNRAGGGAAVVVKETGNYRPALTHHTQCPKEKKWRNVAVLGEFPAGKRLACEACGYFWLYNGALTDIPLTHGVDESLRPSKRFFMNPEDRMTSGYAPAERGA